LDSIIEMRHCTKTKKLLIEVNNTEIISKLSPNFSDLIKIDFGSLNPTMRGIIVTCKGKEYDCISRYFAPWNGINEDPVTGSAHTGTIDQWSI
jgi:predicted PhzF superfamily epimerase YddE/YHI9